MKLKGPAVSAGIHLAVFGLLLIIARTGRKHIPVEVMAFFDTVPAPKPAPELAAKSASSKPSAKSPARAARTGARAPTASAPSASPTTQAPGSAGGTSGGMFDSGLVLDGAEGDIPSDAVVLPATAIRDDGPVSAVPRPAAPVRKRPSDDCDESASDPEPIERVDFEYPRDQAGIAGRLVAKVIVGADGRVRRVDIVHAIDPGIERAALLALNRWRFRPGRRCGRAVESSYTVAFNFELSE